MRRRTFIAAGSAIFAAGAVPGRALPPAPTLRAGLATRAEETAYQETSTYADVQHFLSDLDGRGAPIVRGSLGKSFEGRDIPFVIASRPRVETPEAARKLNRPIVLILAGLRGNEVDGKEAILAILRDLCVSTGKTLLDDLVFAIVPLANPDGNERFGPVAINAPMQNGPARIGTRENAQGIDLDRDFVKIETQETRSIMDFVLRWQPDVFVDLRTDAGSFHDFSVTQAPPLHPAAYFGGTFARERLLPAVSKDLHDKYSMATFVCGQFGSAQPLPAPPAPSDVADFGWFAPSCGTCHATNYFGLRGSVATMVESYCHDDLERRVFTTRAALESILAYCSDNDDDVLTNSKTITHWLGGSVPIRGAYPAQAPLQPFAWENLALNTDDAASPEPGVPTGFKRTDTFTTGQIPVYDRFVPTLAVDQTMGYLIPYEYAAAARRLLERHGIIHTIATGPENRAVTQFFVEHVDRGATAIDGHHTATLSGHWNAPVAFAVKAGAVFVPTVQTLGPLVSVLLEPESDDSFFTWNVFEGFVEPGYLAPVFRVV